MLAALTAGQIEDWLASVERLGHYARPDTGQPHTVRICHNLIATILRDAVKHQLIRGTPMALVARPKIPPPAPKYLAIEELRKVLRVVRESGDPRAVAVELMALLGLRRNEALGLVWSDVNLKDGHVLLAAQLGRSQHGNSSELVRRSLKTMSSRRQLVLPDSLRIRLNELRLSREPRVRDDDFIITLGAGKPVDPDAFTHWLTLLGTSVGVHVSPHRLRHTAATLMLNEGVPIEAVGKVLGHSEIRTTSVYARVLDRSADAALGALSDLVSRDASV